LQPLLILFGAILTLAASFGLGSALLRDQATDAGIRTVTGAALLSLAVFACCAAHLAYPVVFLLLGFAGIAAGWRHLRVSGKPQVRLDRRWWILIAPFLLLYLSNAMAPEISFDGSRYHLGLVADYLRAGGFHPITDNFYSALSEGVEMLYLFAFAFGRHSATAVVHLGLLAALAWQMIAWARRSGFELAGVCAALLVFLSPLAGVDGSSAYNDVAVAAIAFTLFHLLQIWEESRAPRLLAAIGLVAGFAYGAKYTAGLAVPYAIAAVGWKSRKWRDLATLMACAGLMIGPWVIKDWIYFHNPAAPFLNHWFHNRYVASSFEVEYRSQLAHVNLPSMWQIPIQVTTFGSLSGQLGPVFLLAPISLAALRLRQDRQLLLAAVVFGAPFFTNVSARFLLPALPFVALAMALVLGRVPRVAVGVVVLHGLLSWPPVVRAYSHADAWHLNKVTWREALRIKPEDGYLESNLPLYGAARLVERLTPPHATVFTQTPIPEAYTTRHLRTAYQSAANIVSRDIFWSGFMADYAPTRRWRFRFSRQALRGVRLVTTGTGEGVWSMHEIRVFDGSRELSRTGWHAEARPWPWGIEAVLDGNPVTFWQCGEPLRAGQRVEVHFGSTVEADTVLIEAAPNQAARLRLEGLNGSDSETVPLGGTPEVSDVSPPPDLRRWAATELRRRGNDYLLVFDGEFGADDLRTRAGDWGVRLVGAYKGARLYRLP
jgi:hypothetical protein